MSKYICDMSNILAGVLQRAAAAQPAQFAGYWANIEFWVSEYEHLVHIAATYDMRYSVMKAAFDRYVAEHGGPHNRDDTCAPYQGVLNRNAAISRKRLAPSGKHCNASLNERSGWE